MKELKMIINADGVFEEYDDTYDLTIHCTSQEEQDEVLMKLNKLNRTVCTDVINRQATIVALDDRMSSLENVDMQIAMGFAKGIIHEMPPVTPAEKVGQWIYDRTKDWDGECKYECSECGMGSDVDYAYCMRCGCKMQEVKK